MNKDDGGCLAPVFLLVLLCVLVTCCRRLTDIRDRLPPPIEKR